MNNTTAYPPLLLPAAEAASYVGVSKSTLRNLDIPRKTLGAKRLYDRRDLDAFADGLSYENKEANSCDAIFN